MTSAEERWVRLQAAEAADHPDSWSPGAEAARDAEHAVWLHGEEARHDLEPFLDPEGYARHGFTGQVLGKFRIQAEADDPEIEPGG